MIVFVPCIVFNDFQLSQLAFNGTFSARVAKAIMRTKEPPRHLKRQRQQRSTGRRKDDGQMETDGRMSGSKAARRMFLLKRVRDPNIKTSELQKVAAELEGLLRDPRDFTRIISLLGSRHQPDLILKLLEDMDRRLGPSVITYSAAMNSLSKTGDWAMATGLLRQLEERAGKTGQEGPNLISYNTVISALARARRWHDALDIFDELVSKDFIPTESTYSAAMSCCRGEQQWEIALHLNEDMLNRGLRGNLLTWTSLIQAMERYAPVLAVRAYGRMKFSGFQADDQVHNAVLRACAAAGLYKRAIFIINKIVEAGKTPSATAYSNAVAACGTRAGRRGLLLFEEMISKNLSPTPAAYLGVMQAHAQQGSWELVLQHFDELKAQPGRSGRVPYAAYSGAMQAWDQQHTEDESQTRKRGIAGKQLKIFQEMLKRHKYQPDPICHNLAARAHADRFEAVKATKLMEEILEKGYQPSGRSCNAILEALPLSRDGEITETQKKMLYEEGVRGYLSESATEAERLLEKMKEENFEVSEELYSSIITGSRNAAMAARAYSALRAPAPLNVAVAAMAAFTELGRPDEALEIFQELRDSGALALKGQSLELLEHAGIVALNACAADGRWQEALEVLEQLRFRGLQLSPSLYEEAIAACATGDQQKEARRLLSKMLAAGYEPSKQAFAAADLISSIDQLKELERQGFNLPEELVKAAIKEAKLIDDRDLARDLTLKLRVAKTGEEEQRAPAKRQRRKRPERRQEAQKDFGNQDQHAAEDANLPDMDDWDEEDDDKKTKSWEERVTYF